MKNENPKLKKKRCKKKKKEGKKNFKTEDRVK